MLVKIRQATKQGWIKCKVGGVANFSLPNSKTRRGRVVDMGDTSPETMAYVTWLQEKFDCKEECDNE